jgi:RNA polymerase sigma-70 factor (ECF subfamily)
MTSRNDPPERPGSPEATEEERTGDSPAADPESELTTTLLLRLRAGDDSAGAMLERLYHRPLSRYCSGYLGSSADVEDVVQDAFLRVLRAETLPDHFRAWLYRVARNRCLDLLRGRGRRLDDQTLRPEPGVPDDLTGFLTRLVREEQYGQLARAVDSLSASQREILRLRYAVGLSRAEIAEVLEIEESVVKSRLYEGLERLRGHRFLRPGS